jgi:hypothetical protein
VKRSQNIPKIPSGLTFAAFAAAVAAACLLVVGTWALAKRIIVPEYAETRRTAERLQGDLAEQAAQNAELLRRVAQLERALEISDGARGKLRSDLSAQHSEIDGLKADLAFYRGLVGSAGERQGLGAHRVRVESTSSPEVFRLSLTLAQNIRRAKVVSGTVQLNVEGLMADYPERLPWDLISAGGPADGYTFNFKYFQEIDGTISLPPDFVPERLIVLVSTGSGRKTKTEEMAAINWADAFKSATSDSTVESV